MSCECNPTEFPHYCERHKKLKSEHLCNLCKDDRYCDLWDVRAGFKVNTNKENLITKFGKSMLKWAKQGFPVVDKATLDKRLEICNGCEYWNGLGCKKCNCTAAKLGLATESCPIGKWDAETKD